jgi:chromosome segregation ATPase
MSLSTYPSYYHNEPPEKQLPIMRSYLNSMREELEQALGNITYDNLDPSLRSMFDDFEENLYVVQRANSSVASLGNKLQKVLNDYVTSAMLNEALDLLMDDVADAIEYACGQLQTAINDLDRRVGNLETNYTTYSGYVDQLITDVTWLKNNAVTIENTETVIADKKLKVDRLEAVTSVTSPNYYN